MPPDGKLRGKPRAANPRYAERQRPPRSASADRSGTLWLLPTFAALYAMTTLLWQVPVAVGLGYLALSALTLAVYAADKSFARANQWRIPERTLHLLALVGGWPGALVGQEWLRHKSIKPAFRAVFWVTVAANIVAFLLLFSPYGRPLLAAFLLR